MSSLFYLLRRGFVNSLKELIRNPKKMALYGFVLFLVALTGFVSFVQEREPGELAPLFWLTFIWFAYTLFFALSSVKNGLSSGGSFFEMNDVNLLFASPVDSRHILVYGVTKLMKSAFLAAFFILFQASTLKTFFDAQYRTVWFMLLNFMVSIICLTLLSLVIYTWSNGRETRKRVVKAVTALLHAPAVIYFGVKYFENGSLTGALGDTMESVWLGGIPVTGWASRGVANAVTGDWASAWLFLGLVVVIIIAALVFVIVNHADYYEDVLVATETAFERKRALTDGNINAVTTARKIKVAATGIGGSGADVFMHKHLREMFRENRLGIISASSLALAVFAAVVAFVAKDSVSLVAIAAFMMYLQTMKIGTGRGLRELYTHYIYMAPQPPFLKMVWSNVETMIKAFAEAVLVFVAAGAVLGEAWYVIASAVLAYGLYSLFVISVNYLSMRFAGPEISPMVLLILYMLGMIFIMAPGVIPAIAVGMLIGGPLGAAAGLLIVAAWVALASAVCFYAARGILHNCDMPVVKAVNIGG
jgi:hypothetical protein